MLLPLLMTTIAGLSTGLGGLIAALFRPTPRLMAFCGGFAGAVMLTVSLADLAPALLDFYGALLSPFGCGAAAAALLLGGMLAAWLLACALPDEDTLADRFGSRTQGSAMRAALVTGAALLLHNLPEGILTLLTNVSDPQLGARTALAIALHNIPEGLAVAVPFACATGSRAKVLSRMLSPPGMRRKPAHCANAFGPSCATFRSSFLLSKRPFSSRYATMFFAITLLTPELYCSCDADAVFRSTPTLFTQSSTTPPSASPSFFWFISC